MDFVIKLLGLIVAGSPFIIAFVIPISVVLLITLTKALHTPKLKIDWNVSVDLAWTGALIFFTETLAALNKSNINNEKFVIFNAVFFMIFLILLLGCSLIVNKIGHNEENGLNKKGKVSQFMFALIILSIVFTFVSNTTTLYSEDVFKEEVNNIEE